MCFLKTMQQSELKHRYGCSLPGEITWSMKFLKKFRLIFEIVHKMSCADKNFTKGLLSQSFLVVKGCS